MKKLILFLLIASPFFAIAQKVITREGHAKIFSHTVAEDIVAHNYKVTSTINVETGEMVFSIPVQAFEFKRTLMQKHFNQENFMHSSAYPRITFKGSISDLSKVNWKTDGIYNVSVTGDLTIRDITKQITENGVIEVKNGVITAGTLFVVKGIGQYNVGKPTSASKKNNVADDIEVTYRGTYKLS